MMRRIQDRRGTPSMAKSRTTPSFVSPSYAVGLSVLVWRQETADRSVSSQGELVRGAVAEGSPVSSIDQ